MTWRWRRKRLDISCWSLMVATRHDAANSTLIGSVDRRLPEFRGSVLRIPGETPHTVLADRDCLLGAFPGSGTCSEQELDNCPTGKHFP